MCRPYPVDPKVQRGVELNMRNRSPVQSRLRSRLQQMLNHWRNHQEIYPAPRDSSVPLMFICTQRAPRERVDLRLSSKRRTDCKQLKDRLCSKSCRRGRFVPIRTSCARDKPSRRNCLQRQILDLLAVPLSFQATQSWLQSRMLQIHSPATIVGPSQARPARSPSKRCPSSVPTARGEPLPPAPCTPYWTSRPLRVPKVPGENRPAVPLATRGLLHSMAWGWTTTRKFFGAKPSLGNHWEGIVFAYSSARSHAAISAASAEPRDSRATSWPCSPWTETTSWCY
jgi:hypothetical protein